jgi:ABC-type enterochelin transport system substrate-binding protein
MFFIFFLKKKLQANPDSNPDAKVSESKHANNVASDRIRIHNPDQRFIFETA